jgi:hypothetical protein
MNWSFPSNNNGDINGISNSGVETFQGTPLKSLAREICQNSLDAAVNNGVVEVEFKQFTLGIEEVPGAASLKKAFIASLAFWSLQSSKKAQDFFERAIKAMEVDSVSFLRVSDFNTTGLLGSKGEYNTPWCNLTKSSGTSDKAGTAGGSFGIGKFAPFACSDFRTVFYSTLDSESVEAYQGISRITSFRNEVNNEITVGVGYYGADDNLPSPTQLNLDPSFQRGKEQTGTDIFIAGFKYYTTDWKTDIIASILDGFLYAIIRGALVVRVDDVTISKDTLPELIVEYQSSLVENADKYFTVFNSKDTVWYEIDFKNLGRVSLGLIIQPDMHRKVAMIRRTGMKIMDRGSISGIIPFAGVMLIEGEKINDFLRSIENPQHTKWEPERATNRVAAKEFVRDLVNYIKDCLEKLKQDDATEEIDPTVGEYLPDEAEVDHDLIEMGHETEALPDTIKTFETTVIVKRPSRVNMSQKGNETEMEDEEGEIDEEILDGGSGHGNSRNSTKGKGHGENDGEGKGTNPKEQHKSLMSIAAAKVRVVCLKKDAGEYSVTFVPTVSAENCHLELFLSAESQNYEAAIVSATVIGQPPITVSTNRISGLTFAANVAVRLKVLIDYYDYCSMEVRAYGNTI